VERQEEVGTMTSAPVVVGVDGSVGALFAVDQAIAEAEWRHRPLRVAYIDSSLSFGTTAERPAGQPRQVVQEALDRIAAHPSVAATGEIIPGSPESILAAESHRAALIVLGYRGRGGSPDAALGSVARNVACLAACPTLIVRPADDPAGYVLVGVHGSTASDPAVGFAFEEAAMRGASLVALRAWTGPVSAEGGGILPLTYDPDLVAEEQARALTEALNEWRAKYPDVPVHQRLVRSRPGPALVEATGGARLVVVGAHGHRPVPGWLVGSATHLLMHQAHCPVAVVPAG
jgi:nucleotide-binding universal stress UspA family protein